MDYVIKQEKFEGPIHILLDLIQQRKLHVSEISLAVVTEDFLKFLGENKLSHADVSSFITVASTLVLLKARSLLPTLQLTMEEEESITDLTERVRQYQLVQEYAKHVARRFGQSVSYERGIIQEPSVFAPDTQMNLSSIQQCMQGILKTFPLIEKLPEKAIKVVVKLEEIIDKITEKIQQGIAFHTRDMMDKYTQATDRREKREAKVFAVVSFLAILELVKKGIGNALQQESFGNIEFK